MYKSTSLTRNRAISFKVTGLVVLVVENEKIKLTHTHKQANKIINLYYCLFAYTTPSKILDSLPLYNIHKNLIGILATIYHQLTFKIFLLYPIYKSRQPIGATTASPPCTVMWWFGKKGINPITLSPTARTLGNNCLPFAQYGSNVDVYCEADLARKKYKIFLLLQ